jgi:hypothetical protein
MMKKVCKISLFELVDIMGDRVLSEQEKMAIVAGGVDGYCYFYCMEYLTSYYGCSDMDINSYMASYASEYGFSDLQNGGISDMSRIASFTLSYFSISAGINMGNMSAFLNLNASNTIMAFFSTGSEKDPQDHAVVITGYNTATGKYKYKDPTTGKEGELEGSKFRAGMGIEGCQ